jgi:hypothetical protein
MTGADKENKAMVLLTLLGYVTNLVFGLTGYMQEHNSYYQLLCFQIGDAAGIMASVLAGRYVGLRGQHIAASAFILLGITHGISLAALGVESLNIEKGIGVVMPMIPAFLLMYWFKMTPVWLRVLALISPAAFIITYIEVLNGAPYFGWYSYIGYMSWMLVEVLWAWYLYWDLKKSSSVT